MNVYRSFLNQARAMFTLRYRIAKGYKADVFFWLAAIRRRFNSSKYCASLKENLRQTV